MSLRTGAALLRSQGPRDTERTCKATAGHTQHLQSSRPTFAAGERAAGAEGGQRVHAGSGSRSQSTTETSSRTTRPSARQAGTPIPIPSSHPSSETGSHAGRASPALPSKPRPRGPSAPNAHARKCVPAPAPCSVRSLWDLCHLTVVVAGRGRGGAGSAGPPLPPPSARARARSPAPFLSPPWSGTGRSKPLPGARVPSWPPPRVLMEPPNLYPVKLYVYDLSKGLARRLSPIMLGEGPGVRGKKAGGRPQRPAEPGRGAHG